MNRTRSKHADSSPASWICNPRRVLTSPAGTLLCGALLLAGCASAPPAEPERTAEPVIERTETAPAPSVVIRDAHGAALDIPTQHADIWERVRAGFGMSRLDSPLVAKHEQWFVNNPEFMTAMMDRASMYLYYIVDEVEKRGLPTEIALLPAIESAFKPYAYSRAKAAGLWQFIPSTGRLYGLKANWWYDGRRDVAEATRAALDYLEKLRDDFDGDWHLALAAYNAGEGKVSRMIEYNRRRGQPTDYEHLKLRAETRNYVPRLLAFVNIVSDPEKYGVRLAHIPNSPYFARIETGSQIDLSVVARLADLDVEELHKINPGFNRRATDPDGPHYLFVPVDKKELVEEALNNLPESERVQYRHHQVARGQTLSAIAQRYHVSVEAIKSTNRLRSNFLRVGQDLVIPVSTGPIRLAVASPARAKAVSAPVRKPSGAKPVIHWVRSGETLWSIAKKYNVLVTELRKWNLLEASDMLRIGQRLKIWLPKMSSTAVGHEPRIS